jgi:hypothetical protein
VTLEWEKTGAHPVPAPALPDLVQRPAPKDEPKPVAEPRMPVGEPTAEK